jgi:tRNA pseudouridine synthase 10
MQELFERAREILSAEQICDRCLGRCFARLGTEFSNPERGRSLRVVLAMLRDRPVTTVEPEACSICRGVLHSVDEWAGRLAERLREYEFRTYLVGTRVPAKIEEAERALWERYKIPRDQTEPIKQEFNREVGKRLEGRLVTEGRRATVDFSHPEATVLIDLAREELDVRIRSLYIYGRYRKLARGSPQTKWPCRHCKGRGCSECGGTGKQYPESVEELIAVPVMEAAGGEGHTLHGAGREDIDALMLGSGRPFVLEIKAPRRRSLDLQALERAINERASGKVEVEGLRFVHRAAVEAVKTMEGKRKSYRTRVAFERPVSQSELDEALNDLIGEIRQRTPRRVSHRRADLERVRRVYEIHGRVTGEREAVIELVGEGGLYVKELISGDEGRTRPNLAGLLRTGARVTELDVTEIHGGLEDAPHPPD